MSSQDNLTDDTTDFGYERVKTAEKAGRVREVFDSVAAQYDLMNDLMSGGLIGSGSASPSSSVPFGPGRPSWILRVVQATSLQVLKTCGCRWQSILADINAAMLSVGRDRLIDKGALSNIDVVQADAQFLPFEDNSIDCITIAFGLRNVADKAKALRSMHRVLKPGGRVLVLEFSKPTSPLLSKVYDAYSFSALPAMGKLITDDADSYRYLAESIRKHPDQESLLEMVEDAGFVDCRYHNMTGGIVAVHRGIKG